MRSGALLLASRLCEALRAEDDRMVVVLLQEGANPNLVLPEGVAAIHLAAGVEQGCGIRRLSLLLQHGGDPNARSGDDLTPVHVAASWGCASCLTLLLLEGGDPRLEDQDGNTALDLALEQGNETCASILQGGRSSCFAQRRAESFLSTLNEDAGETGGPLSRLCDSLPCPAPFSPKEALPGACSQCPGATPHGAPGGGQDRSTSSFLSEGSWQCSPRSDPAPSCAPSAVAFFPPSKDAGKPVPSRAEGRVCPAGGVMGSKLKTEAGVNRPCQLPGFPEGGSCLESVCLGGTLTDSPSLFPKSPEKPPASPSLKLKADRPPGLQGTSRGHPLSWHCSFHDPPLVRLASQERLDVSSPAHAFLLSQDDPTTASDLERTVVAAAGLLKASKTLSGCSARGRPSNGSSASSTDQFVSCVSGYSAGGTEDPGGGEAEAQGDWKAPFFWSPGCSDGNGGMSGLGRGRHSGLPLCAKSSLETGTVGKASASSRLEDLQLLPKGAPHREISAQTSQVRQDSVLRGSRKSETAREPSRFRLTQDELLATGAVPEESRATGVAEQAVPGMESGMRLEGSALVARGQASRWGVHTREEAQWGLKRGSLCPRGAEGRPASGQDTLPVQGSSEEKAPSQGSRSSEVLGRYSGANDAEVSLRPAASVGDEAASSLDARLRSRMLTSKAFRSPHCHVTLRPQTPRAGPPPEDSGSPSSFFEEALEMPQCPGRGRAPRGTVAPSGGGAPSVREANEASEVRPIPAGPGDGKALLGTLSCSTAGPAGLRTPGGGVAGGNAAGSGLELLPSAEEQSSCSAPESPPARQGPEGLRAQCSWDRGPGDPSRVSFSRLPAWEPSGVGLARSRPISRDVLLSPGGRPVNPSATEAAEYLYLDVENGHALVERHAPPAEDSLAGSSGSEDTALYDWRAYAGRGRATREKAPSRTCCLSEEALAQRLRGLAICPGPARALLGTADGQALARMRRDPQAVAQRGSAAYSPELASALETLQVPDSREDEAALGRQFDRPDRSRRWREGLLKSSFNYLLLDPRVTQNLPLRSRQLGQAECFRAFVGAIFYVGKGRRSRPYCHLYEALAHRQEGRRKPGTQACSKVRHILEIWASGQGVVSVHCFQNVIPVEAYTREACMVDAIGLKMLTNQKRGNYYGVVAGWPMKRRRRLGVHLLHRAMQIFLAEGERQLRPADL